MKIPFERTIAGAYRFAFINFLSIIGIGWFPFLLFAALTGGLLYTFGPHVMEALKALPAKADPARPFAAMAPILLGELILLPALLVVMAMVNVGVMRKALGQHPGPVFIFFSLGAQVWRLVATYFLVMVLMIGVITACAFGIALVVGGLGKFAPQAATPVGIVLGVLAGLWCIYAGIRVFFFLPAVVVAENHIGIRRSWHLGKGNFWRIVGIVLIMTIPLSIAAQTLESSFMQMFVVSPTLAPGATPQEAQAFFGAMIDALKHAWPYLAAIVLLHLSLSTGLSAGAVANAYRLVTGGDDIAPPPAKVSV